MPNAISLSSSQNMDFITALLPPCKIVRTFNMNEYTPNTLLTSQKYQTAGSIKHLTVGTRHQSRPQRTTAL